MSRVNVTGFAPRHHLLTHGTAAALPVPCRHCSQTGQVGREAGGPSPPVRGDLGPGTNARIDGRAPSWPTHARLAATDLRPIGCKRAAHSRGRSRDAEKIAYAGSPAVAPAIQGLASDPGLAPS